MGARDESGQASSPMGARSWLFVPGDRDARFDRAVASGAEAVILDLEDAVSATEKSSARLAVSSWLQQGGEAWVRVNGTASPWHDQDIESLSGLAGLLGVVLPKTESGDDVLRIGRLNGGLPVVALIETAAGVQRAIEIAEADHPTVRLAFGSIDFAQDIGAAHDDQALLLARSMLVIASRISDRLGPIDGVTSKLGVPDLVTADAERARALGFAGKLCIHPEQVSLVHGALAPTASDISWAEDVLAALERGGAGVEKTADGEMVDKPVADRARRIVAEAAELGSRGALPSQSEDGHDGRS